MMAIALAEYRELEVDGRTVLFVVPTGALFEADPDTAAELRSLHAGGARHGAALARHPLVDDLLEAGLLLDGVPGPSRPTDGRFASLVLEVSRGCNLACGYCYGPRGGADPAGPSLSPSRAEEAVDWLMDRRAAGVSPSVTFFGGEPLLEPAAMRAAADRALRRASGAPVTFSLTTNATRIDEGTAGWLASLGARVTVSVDGPAGAHDAARRWPGGRGSYADVIDRLPLLLDRCDVTARATLTRRSPDPEPVVDHLLGLGFDQVGVAAVDAPPGSPWRHDAASLARLSRGMDRLAGRYLDAALEGGHVGVANLDGALRAVHRGTVRWHPCGAGLRLLACGADGGLYPCHRFVGDPRHRLGSIDGEEPSPARWLGARALSRRPACRRCWARHLCGGGCHHARQQGSLRSGRMCDHVRGFLDRALRIYVTLARRRPAFIDEWIDPPGPCAVS